MSTILGTVQKIANSNHVSDSYAPFGGNFIPHFSDSRGLSLEWVLVGRVGTERATPKSLYNSSSSSLIYLVQRREFLSSMRYHMFGRENLRDKC